MIVKRANAEDVGKIIFDKDIIALLEDDDNKITEVPKGAQYIGCYVNNEIKGFVMYEWNNNLYYTHICMLKGYRGVMSLNFARKALEFRECNVLYTNVDESLRHVCCFAVNFGFKLWLTQKGVIKKDGKKLDLRTYRLEV